MTKSRYNHAQKGGTDYDKNDSKTSGRDPALEYFLCGRFPRRLCNPFPCRSLRLRTDGKPDGDGFERPFYGMGGIGTPSAGDGDLRLRCDRLLYADKLYKLTYAEAGDLGGCGRSRTYGPAAGLVLADCGCLPDLFLLSIPVADGFNSATVFITNNFKQSVLGWTQYALTKDKEFKRKAVLYSNTVLMFFLGALLGVTGVAAFGNALGACVGFIPLAVARIFISIGELPVEDETPEETEEEAEEMLEEAKILEKEEKKKI